MCGRNWRISWRHCLRPRQKDQAALTIAGDGRPGSGRASIAWNA
jgi:hypothetical protein